MYAVSGQIVKHVLQKAAEDGAVYLLDIIMHYFQPHGFESVFAAFLFFFSEDSQVTA